MAELIVVKNGGMLFPIDDDAKAVMAKLKQGVELTAKVAQPRNVKFHRKFFAMVKVGFDAWEPPPARPTKDCRKLISILHSEAHKRPAAKQFVDDINRQFYEWFSGTSREEEPAFDEFRKDCIIMAGYYKQRVTLGGSMVIEAESIKFGSMDQETFDKLYNAVCNVILTRVLTNYTRDDLDSVVAEILRF